MKLNATGVLSRLVTVDYWMQTSPGGGVDITAGMLGDTQGNLSEPFKMPRSPIDLFQEVDECVGHVFEDAGKQIERRLQIDCPALGHLAISEPEHRQAIRRSVQDV